MFNNNNNNNNKLCESQSTLVQLLLVLNVLNKEMSLEAGALHSLCTEYVCIQWAANPPG